MTISIYASPYFLLYCAFVALALGAALGSFLNCAAWRIARGESFVTGRSRCPHCGHVLGALDLVPLLSWFLLRGRCRYCGCAIQARYPLAEGGFALLTLLCLLRFDLTVLCARNLVFLGCLFCLALVDLERYIIPDGCLAAALLAWLASAPLLFPSWSSAAHRLGAGALLGGGMLLFSLLMDRLLKKETLGGGDVKLFAIVGLYLGAAGGLFTLIISCLLGLLFAALLRRGMGQPFPFGPAIAAAAAGMLLFGEGITAWYLSLF